MATPDNLDGIIITWGDRLFYPGNRVVKVRPSPRLSGDAARQRAAVIRQRIAATVVRRAPQVMVKVTGGGRGLRAIAAHFRYISKNGRLEIEDQRGEIMRGKDVLHDLAEEWRFSGSYIPDGAEPGHRREAFNIMLSMPRGTDPLTVQRAAREFAQVELRDHKYVMVLHDHQANPHVHISVRAESTLGKRLNPRKSDLHRWRETFAEKLRGYGVDAEATRQATRGQIRNYDPLWRIKAQESGRLRAWRPDAKVNARASMTRAFAVEAWVEVGKALSKSESAVDQFLAKSIARFVKEAMAPTGRGRSLEALDTRHMPQAKDLLSPRR
ncbi:relaxase/mobilization nuclease domain-containing protein [Acidovorax temperans]|uniref:relaxase/mobilization nuclease domain-containing protein n=1 Tax=Acidovorax temperans TaxID=80878 RepID=UPI0005CA7A09|nr:relaxase/mobilization nuclease domain-containing protein [Acidovorax temperans]